MRNSSPGLSATGTSFPSTWRRGVRVSRSTCRIASGSSPAARSAHASPLAALLDFATCASRFVRTPEEFANQIAFFQLDLTDPEFHALALEYFRVEREELRALLDDAVAAGELRPGTDTDRLARGVQVAVNGARVVWAVVREGTLEEWTREELEALLAPRRSGGGGGGGLMVLPR
ncbi:MAG TPA: TetR family transcriptional regulator C-terminal domain-containing protein [Longimicrobiaceae bacterium]|nr:TetR family transcriptional regulator C-terminal domain-containing protein [Longimicrobiaceae bacterium]